MGADKNVMLEWIAAASYESLLRRWRFGPTGDPMFQGNVGDAYMRRMAEIRAEKGEEFHTMTSKRVGWRNLP